ncbi:MAG: methyltransferase domain-containing protein [Rhodospirillaceae bacterium]
MKNFLGKDYTSVAWLTAHFHAKLSDRLREISQLPIFSGDKVLDIGCGPGLYGRYLASLVGEHGRLICIDQDTENVRIANIQLENTGFQNWDVLCMDFNAAADLCQDADVIIIFNSLSYAKNPHNVLIQFFRSMKSGARLVIKDFDQGFISFSGISIEKWGHLLTHAFINNNERNPLSCDNFFGRRVHLIHQMHECSHYYNRVWTQCIAHPFTPAQIKYIYNNIDSLSRQAERSCDQEVLEYFKSAFCEDQGWFYTNDSSIFIENEFITVLTK